MAAHATFSLLLLLSFTLVLSSDLPTSAKSVSCPCTCFVPRKADKAFHQCADPIYKPFCSVSSCYKRGKTGKQCCHSAPPPTPTPSMSPKVIPCPCYCRRGFHTAVQQCKQPHISPKCKVLPCGRNKYECCDTIVPPTPTPSVTPSPKVIPCPCVCRPRGYRKAAHECAQPYISPKCKVLSCLYRGSYQCCNKEPTPTPSVTPSPKVIPCPCVCRPSGYRKAAHECAQPYISPKCKVLSCLYRGSYQCCDKEPTPTPSVTPSPKVIPCPCVCRPRGYRKAAHECAQPYISPKCKVLSCLYRGSYQCCDKEPTPPPTPTPSTKPKCPCYCTKLIIAVKECKSLPHCQWSECRKHGFSCCDKH